MGFSYRDWAGIFYPQGAPPRRQLSLYCEQFDVCELTQFTHQMPDQERMSHFAAQLKSDIRMFVRIHNTFTHCADVGLALTMAKHFRRAMDPLYEAGKLAGLVAAFPYAFKDSPDRRDYIQQLASGLGFGDLSLQLDFRHPSWASEEALEWMKNVGLAFVCVDEPQLPGLLPPIVAATGNHALVRMHGRNGEAWWSGNTTTRHDYSYSVEELREMAQRYAPLIRGGTDVSFVFQNHWQAQAVYNAQQFKALAAEMKTQSVFEPLPPYDEPIASEPVLDEDNARPPMSLSLSEVKSRVSREFSSLQVSLDLPLRDDE